METLSIRSESEAAELLNKALDGAIGDSPVNIRFESWPVLAIRIEGDRYNSTLPSSLMRALLEYQTVINRFYAEQVLNKPVKSLTQEEREQVELIFHVQKGSSKVVAKLDEFFANLVSEAIGKMSPNQLVGLAATGAIVLGGLTAYETHTAHQLSLAKEETRRLEMQASNNAIQRAMQSNENLARLALEASAAQTNLLRSVDDADLVEINGTELEASDIALLTRTERVNSTNATIVDSFKINLLKAKDNHYAVDLVRTSDNLEIKAELPMVGFNMAQKSALTSAFMERHEISLGLVVRKRGESISKATVVSITVPEATESSPESES